MLAETHSESKIEYSSEALAAEGQSLGLSADQEPNLLSHALALAAEGFYVFPCRPNDKPPAHGLTGWQDISTTDPNAIRMLWQQYGTNCNIGIDTGKSGLAVIDVDNKNGAQGDSWWSSLQLMHGDAPATRVHRTPSGGRHFLFKQPGNIGGSPLVRGHIDVRGVGGLVLGPGSIINGVPYTVEHPGPIAWHPSWLKEAQKAREREAREAPEGFEPDTPNAIERAGFEIQRWIARGSVPVTGDRNHTVAALAGRLKGLGISQELAIEMIDRDYLPYGEAPDEATAFIVASMYRSAVNPAGSELPPTGKQVFDGALAIEQAAAGTANKAPSTAGVQLKLSSGADRQPTKVRWLWPGYLARSKFHILGGQKGTGKTTLVLSLFATLSIGGKWPDGTRAPGGDVLIWSAEDDIDDTLLPRFMAAGGDPSRLHFVDTVEDNGEKRAFDPATDMPHLAEKASELPNLAAVMIDPVVSAVRGDSHKNAETRHGLQPLVDFAARRNVALIGITHFTKNTQGREPIERITGSLAFGALPRVVFGTARGEKDVDARRFVRIASNIGKDGGGFEYFLRQEHVPGYDMEAQRVVWSSQLSGRPQELLQDAGHSSGQGSKAITLLNELLGEAGAGGVPSIEIKKAAAANGISWPTVERAKEKMGNIDAFRRPGAGPGVWCWRLQVSKIGDSAGLTIAY